jgi:hypothetical protein
VALSCLDHKIAPIAFADAAGNGAPEMAVAQPVGSSFRVQGCCSPRKQPTGLGAAQKELTKLLATVDQGQLDDPTRRSLPSLPRCGARKGSEAAGFPFSPDRFGVLFSCDLRRVMIDKMARANINAEVKGRQYLQGRINATSCAKVVGDANRFVGKESNKKRASRYGWLRTSESTKPGRITHRTVSHFLRSRASDAKQSGAPADQLRQIAKAGSWTARGRARPGRASWAGPKRSGRRFGKDDHVGNVAPVAAGRDTEQPNDSFGV